MKYRLKEMKRLRFVKFFLSMLPVLWSLIKDLIWEDLSLEEIRTNYLFGKANAYDRGDFLDHAAKIYREILGKDPNSVAVFLNLGGLYYRRGIFDAAIAYYEKVIRINPKHYQGHYWLAMCCWKLNRYYAAINTLEEVVEFLPTFKDALNLMGECYEEIGESAKAEHYYLKAISTDPHGIVLHRTFLNPEVPETEERLKH
jgi:tetratricopeptide (TPR) repeat protein